MAREPLSATVVGDFDELSLAQKALSALLAAGVPEARITLGGNSDRTWTLSVHAESSLERERVRSLLQGSGALHTEQRER